MHRELLWIFSTFLLIDARFPDLYEGSPCTLHNGHSGVCKLLLSCDLQLKNLANGAMTYSQLVPCGFVGFDQIVCCENESRPDVNPTTGGPGGSESDSNTTEPNLFTDRSRGERIKGACEEHSKIAHPFYPDNIINGWDVERTEYPHMAALGYPYEDGEQGYEFNCGGCLISDQWILTAAHCVPRRRPPTLIRMGVISLQGNETTPVDRTVKQSIRHPSYRADVKQNDIALVQLDQPVILNSDVRPACIRTEIDDVSSDAELVIAGWGSINAKKTQRAGVLQQAVVSIVPLTSCNDTLTKFNEAANHPSFREGLLDSQLCALDTTSARDQVMDACVGDSGGPIFTYDESGVSTVIGVVSFGVSCGSNLPSVYTRTASYIDWIEGVVWSK